MASNLSQDDELRGILSDVARGRFSTRRQINPQSNLFQTTAYAVQEGLIMGAKLDSSFSTSLAGMDLTSARLTSAGEAKLAALMQTTSTKDH
ncbi:hypothetical protein [Limosilactobacillus antri]|uniref:hypothetical protein n=1 Tax=Limosilactobacillus antri TaxID=227943 RepID=UPI001F5910EF|nr:hypothetical protein [Limosilactobacillus antri]